MAGITRANSNKRKEKAHVLNFFYVADIFESEDLLNMNHGSQTAFPCHRCFVEKLEIIQITDSRENLFGRIKSAVGSIRSVCGQRHLVCCYVPGYSTHNARAIVAFLLLFMLQSAYIQSSTLTQRMCCGFELANSERSVLTQCSETMNE